MLRDDVLPDGTICHKGDTVCFFPWVMGRTEYADAETFQPERFLSNPKPNPFVFTAFQAGPRTCLGQSLAILEMKCAIARLLLAFEFSFGQDPSTVTYANSLTLPILGGLILHATPLTAN